jgi:integrase
VRREHGFLKGFFEKAVQDGLIRANPWKGVRAPGNVPRTRVLGYEEEATLRGTLRPDYQRLLTVILGTGMREGELLGLRPKDITPTHVWVTGKFGKSRKIPLRTDVRAALDAQRRGQDYWTQDPSSLRQALSEACVRARIPHVTIHDLRRTFASRCAAANMPPKMLQDILGHASMEITMRHYVHVDERAAVQLLETMPLMPGQKVVALKARQS